MINKIMKKLDFPDEAVRYFNICFEKILSDGEVICSLYEAVDNFYCSDDMEYNEILMKISEKTGIHKYTTDMIFLLLCTQPVYYIYKDRGYSDELFYDTMSDLKCKLYECKNVYNVWGTFVVWWYKGFFILNRFKLGRLEYDKAQFFIDDYNGIVKKGDTVLSCHIPSCGPLNINDVYKSLSMAYEFYKDLRIDGNLVVICGSWLLYTPLIKQMPEESNIKKFYNLFDIVQINKDEKNGDFWRIFNKEYYDGILNDIVPQNSLQKLVSDFLRSGEYLGGGVGIIVVNEEFLNSLNINSESN